MRAVPGLVACAAVLGLAGPAHAAAPKLYVALGDSYTAGPGIPEQYGGACDRSTNNYPAVVAAALGAQRFVDESCSGAETVDMLAPQGDHRPQFDALSADADLVTVGIGGNDSGLVGAAVACATMGALQPFGKACRTNFTKSGRDELEARIAATAPKIAAVLQGIHQRSPRARVLLVGYPNVLPRTGGNCYPLVPFSSDDVVYFDGILRKINAMLAEQAAVNDAEFADTDADSVGHDVCKLPDQRWFEALIPGRPAAPLHPNVLGEASMGRSVLKQIAKAPPAPSIAALTRTAARVRPGKGTRLRFTLDRPATVAITVRRIVNGNGRGRPRVIRVAATQGANSVPLGPKRLTRKAGVYRVTLTPQGRLRMGAPATTTIRVLSRAR